MDYFHVTWVTHNSRRGARMRELGIQLSGPAIKLTLEEEVKIAKGKIRNSKYSKVKENKAITTCPPLWAQKFNRVYINTEEYLHNAIHYIKTNRIKYSLQRNHELEEVIAVIVIEIGL